MSDLDPGKPVQRGGSLWDRFLALLVFAVFLYLIYLAINGRLDSDVNRFASWLKHLLP